MDDASRFIAGFGVFEHATGRNAIAVLHEAISNHGSPASILTDHGSQFYANAGEHKQKGASEFEDTYHQRSIVESVFSSFKCRFTARLFAQRRWQHKDCSCSSGAFATTCCHSGTTQKIRVVCLAYAVQSWNVLAQDVPYHILSQEIPSYTGKQKQESADKVTSYRPEKLKFGQRHIWQFL